MAVYIEMLIVSNGCVAQDDNWRVWFEYGKNLSNAYLYRQVIVSVSTALMSLYRPQ
jgi:hypothetical protein